MKIYYYASGSKKKNIHANTFKLRLYVSSIIFYIPDVKIIGVLMYVEEDAEVSCIPVVSEFPEVAKLNGEVE